MIASVIIPTRNRPKDLANMLERLVPQIPPDEPVEIRICDDSDGTDTRDFLEKNYPNIVWQAGPRRGPGANRNVGAKSSTADFLIFLDDDCLPRAGCLQAILSAARRAPEKKLIAGATYACGESHGSLLWEAPVFTSADHGLPPSCNFAIPRKLYLEAGGFDERYRISFEDMEFFARLKALDTPITFVPEAAVDHPVRPIPSVRTLASRWEARVVSTLDFGATSRDVLLRLPRHIFMVILSRFRGRSLSAENLRAAALFAAEFLQTLARLPSWLNKYSQAPKSPFWTAQVSAGKAPPRFGL